MAVLAGMLAAALSGCAARASKLPSEPEQTEAAADPETEDGRQTEEQTEPSEMESESEGETEEPEEETRETAPGDDETFVQQKIIVATDLHYLAEDLAGNRGQSFMTEVESGDGRVLQYGWEVLDAFLDDVIAEKPDLVVLTGDLTLNGERESHEELARKLEVLSEHGIETAVIPGNHDIHNPMARKFTSSGTEKTDSITAEQFAQIYSDYGYIAADSRDPASLSYLYKLDDYYWLLMLDSCQYDPVNRVGGMIRSETYDWLEEQLDAAWEEGAQVITVTHHNLLEQSEVSREFSDDCTIEHNEVLVRMLADYEVRLHLSGHLHLQHYKEDEDSGIAEIVTGSLVMSPCNYGVLKIWNSGMLDYTARPVDVEGWAKRNSYKNRELSEFQTFSEQFLGQVAYRNAVLDLRKHTMERKLFFSDERIQEMAAFYAKLCIHYYAGTMFQIADAVKTEKACEYWTEIDYVSDLSDFLQRILEDQAKDFSHLTLPY